MKQSRHVHWHDYRVAPCGDYRVTPVISLYDTIQPQSHQVNWRDFFISRVGARFRKKVFAEAISQILF
jgi:hypothetical protein